MSDIVGSASYDILPDLSGFMSALQSGLDAALSDAQSTIDSAAAKMGASLSEAPADAVSSFADLTSSVSSDMGGATSAVSAAANNMVSSIGGVSAESASTFQDVASQATTAGEEAKSNIAASMTSLGEIVTGVAVGNLLADGIKAGVDTAIDSIQGLITALPDIGEQFHRSFQQIRVGTGLTGAALEDMKQSFNDVFAKTPASSSEVAGALTLVRQRLDLTGDAAETTALSMIKLARVTGSDVNQTVDKATAIFNNFSVAASDQTSQLDKFLRVSQITGVGVDDLLNSIQSSGLAFKAAGFNIDETAALIGNLSKVGLDAGAIQMGLSRAVAASAKEGIPARKALDDLFQTIALSEDPVKATAVAVENFGTRAGPRLAELIRTGRLSYADLVKTIESGGDTINAAAADTATWRGAMALLAHQLQEVVEPAALFVFNTINTGIRAVIPIISQLAKYVGSVLTPVFFQLVAGVLPVWLILDRVRKAFADAVSVFDSSVSIFDNVFNAVTRFVTVFTGSEEAGVAAGFWIQNLMSRLVEFWNALQPVRDAISTVFSTIKDAIGGFIEQNPGAVLAGLAAVVGGVLLSALVALGGFLAGLVATFAGFVAGVLVIPLAIGALVAAIIVAYNNFETFHNIVDTVFSFLSENVPKVLEGIADGFRTVWPLIVQVGESFKGMWDQIQPALAGLWTSLQPLLSWLIDHWQLLGIVLLPIIVPLKLIWDHLSQIVDVLKPFVAAWANIVGGLFTGVINVISGLVDVLTGLFSFDWDKVGAGLYKIAEAVATFAANIGGHLLDLLGVIGPKLAEWFGQLAGNIPGWIATAGAALLSALATLLSNIPGWLLTALTALGAVIVQGLTAAWDWLVANGPGILVALAGFVLSIPGKILEWLGAIGPTLVSWLLAGFQWVLDKQMDFLGGIFEFITSLPQRLLNLLSTGLSFVLTFLVDVFRWAIDHGPEIIEGAIAFFNSLPGRFVDAIGALGSWLLDHVFKPAWDFIVERGPDIIAGAIAFFNSLPGRVVDGLSNLRNLLFDALKAAFQWVVDNGPGLIQSAIDFFNSLPGRLFDAFKAGIGAIGGAVGDLAKTIWNAIADFMNDKFVNPVRGFSVNIAGKDFTPFEGIPTIPKAAMGMIVDSPTIAQIGEAGREVVIPLTRPARAQQLADQSGLTNMIHGGNGDTNIQVNVTVQPPAGMTPDQARALGGAIGDGIDVASRTLRLKQAIAAA